MPPSRKVKLSVHVATADGAPADIWVALPLAEPDLQTAPGESGYRFVRAGQSVDYEATVERYEQSAPEGWQASTATGLTPDEQKDLARYLQPEHGNEPDGEFLTRSRSIAPDEKQVVKVARAVYEYVLANMKYDKPLGKAWGHGSVKWACSEGYGNCTDFHALFMNLCRARGIPARFTMGISLPGDAKGTVEGYHCWCEFYVSGTGWVPVDASEAWKHPEKRDYFFGHLDQDRIAFVAGRDLTLEPAQSAGPVGILPIAYAERDGKPVDVKRSIAYENVR